MERIFEPFFTTKDVGKGTGLGLAAVHGIVAAHKGVVTVTSRPGHGAIFEIFLPTITGAVTASDVGVPGEKPCGNEAILIVDDEQQVGFMLTNMLRRLGYTVDCFASAVDALAAFERTPDAWALVITDQMMPRMTGFELAKRILARKPEMPVLLCSGYTDTVSPETAVAAGIQAFLAKPVDHALLARTIRSLLDERKP
jgi:CheY-like chemotaxis protein